MTTKPFDTIQEDVPTVDGWPMRVSFSPEAIRDHFGMNNRDETTVGLTDEDLLYVANECLDDSNLWEAYDTVLVRHINALREKKGNV